MVVQTHSPTKRGGLIRSRLRMVIASIAVDDCRRGSAFVSQLGQITPATLRHGSRVAGRANRSWIVPDLTATATRRSTALLTASKAVAMLETEVSNVVATGH
jgi:hypothetical protein